MLIAANEKNDQIFADKDLCKSEDYYCPSCQNPVHLKAGSVMRPHFAHYQKEVCDVFSEGETEEHILGKQQLYEWLVNLGYEVEMEAYLPKLMQRPDLLLKWKNQKIAIEFQCSGISIEKVKARTEGYLQNGYKVIWILGEHFTYKRKLTAFQKACLTYIQDQLVLFHYSVSKNRLEYRYDFQIKQNQKMTEAKKMIRTGSQLKLNLKRQCYQSSKPLNIEMEHQKLQRQLQYKNHNHQEFLQTLYKNNETLISMPKETYEIVPSEWILQTHSYLWKLQFIVWLESQRPKTVITTKKLHNWTGKLTYYVIPQLSTNLKMKPILEFIQVLTKSEVLKQVRFDKWVYIQPTKRYKFLEDKY